MKTWVCPFAVLMIVTFQLNADAQTSGKKVYLESGELFKNVAALKLRHLDEEELEMFGRNVQNGLTTEKHRERKAADLLLEFQSDPLAMMESHRSPPAEAKPGKSGAAAANMPHTEEDLEAGLLFSEYVDALIKESPAEGKDPLKELREKLRSSDGQRKLNEDLERRLGDGPEREHKAADLLVRLSNQLSPQNILKLRSELKGKPTETKAPYPFCLWWPPCPT